ncbi:MAG: PKD domain-containing protein, partial [Acidobacteriota bacterium]
MRQKTRQLGIWLIAGLLASPVAVYAQDPLPLRHTTEEDFAPGTFDNTATQLNVDGEVALAQVRDIQAWVPQAPLVHPSFGVWPLYWAAGVVVGNRVFVLGGVGPFGPTNAVLYSDVDNAGDLGPWNEAPPLPVPLYQLEAVVVGDWVYAIGGSQGGPPTAGVYRAPIQWDAGGTPTLGAWALVGSMNTPRTGHRAVAYRGEIYVIGGYNGSVYLNTVERTRPDINGDLPPFVFEPSLPNPPTPVLYEHAAAASCGRLFTFGGWSFALVQTVHSTIINDDGSLAGWEVLPDPLPFPVYYTRAVTSYGRPWVVGGTGPGFNEVSMNLFAPDGNISSPWVSDASLPTEYFRHVAVMAGPKGSLMKDLFVIGGIVGGGPSPDVQRGTMVVPCGDGCCSAPAENCSNCDIDCGPCGAMFCGDGICDPGENSINCPGDCPPCGYAYCGSYESPILDFGGNVNLATLLWYYELFGPAWAEIQYRSVDLLSGSMWGNYTPLTSSMSIDIPLSDSMDYFQYRLSFLQGSGGNDVLTHWVALTPYLGYQSHTLIDCGNFDGNVNPGETVRIWPEVKNSGVQDAFNVNGTLSTTTPGVIVTIPVASYPPNIPGGTSAPPSTPFEFTVDSAVPCGTPIDLRLELFYDDGVGNPCFNFSAGEVVEVADDFGSPTNVAVFEDVANWWGPPSAADILTAYGIPYSVFGSTDMGLVDLSPYNKVIITGNQDQPFYDALVANKAWFEAWISAGGVFEMHAANNVGSSLDSYVYPGDFSTFWVLSDPPDLVAITDPAHPIVNTPNPITDAGLDGWNSSTHAYIDMYPVAAKTILEDDGANPGQPVAMEWFFGAGAVVVTTQTIPASWTADGPLVFENFVLYMPGCESVVCNPAAPFLRYDSHFVDDSGGNMNGLFNPGETNFLWVTLENPSWFAGATDPKAALSTTEPGVTILDSTAYYPNIPASGFGTSIAPHFQVQVHPAVPCGTVLDFTLDILAAEGSWTDTFTVTVATFFEDMEGGVGGWTLDPPVPPDPDNLWHQIIEPTCSPAYKSPSTSWYFGDEFAIPSCTYEHGGVVTRGSLVSPVISNLAQGAALDFWFRKETECGFLCGNDCPYDNAYVEISTDGVLWFPLMGGLLDPLGTGELCDDSDIWLNSGDIDLSAYAGSDIQIRFRFNDGDGVVNNFTGWMVDDVRVTTCEGYVPCPDLSVVPVCSVTNVCLGDSASFIAGVSGGTPPYDYLWNFGNGATSSAANPTYTYPSPGVYAVTLQVTDSCGYIPKVWGPGTVCTVTVVDPIASPTDFPDPVEVWQVVQFAANPSGGTPPYTFFWDFDDGIGTSTLQDPTYAYASPGTYNYSVTITDSNGCGGSGSGTIGVYAVCSLGEWEPTFLQTNTGHAVLIGHDYFASNPDQNRIAGNAVFLSTASPVQMLSYIQYSDNVPGGEYLNTLAAINSVSTDYVNTEFSDYGQLDDLLPGKDVLLIPEQENAGIDQLRAIGAAWARDLQRFVNGGGVVVLCDHNWGSGGTWEIFNRSGLMSISGSLDTGGNVDVVAPADPVAAGVTTPYLAGNGSLSFSTGETTVVARNSAAQPVVIHKKFSPPQGRRFHTETWAPEIEGMFVWGGNGSSPTYKNDGVRYNPEYDTWVPIPTAPLAGRRDHTAVWTGTELIIWGGYSGSYYADGASYDPSTGVWTPLPAAPICGRYFHTAVWTGTEMIVWGGYGYNNPPMCTTFGYLADGASYNPSTGLWTSITAPIAGRRYHSAVWTGAEMIVWGGYSSTAPTYKNDGARYNPSTGGWAVTSTIGAPTGRRHHTAVWTGTEMIVWGGYGSATGRTNTGGRYNPLLDAWTGGGTTTVGAPSVRDYHSAVWTGREMIVWGGWSPYTNTGGRYDPSSNSWVPTAVLDAPTERYRGRGGVWTGAEFVVWGGYGTTVAPSYKDTGGRYTPPGPSNVAIFQNSNPWGYTSNQDVLTANGIPFTIFSSADMGVVDLSPFDKVVIPSVQSLAFYDALVANKAWFESWVSTGGIFEMHAAENTGAVNNYIFPGDFSIYRVLSDAVGIVDPEHPIVNTPNLITDTGTELDSWSASTHAYIDMYPVAAKTILEDDGANAGEPVAQEWQFGCGKVVVSTQTLEHGWDAGKSTILENFLLYTCNLVECVCITSATATAGGPTTFCDGGSVTLTAMHDGIGPFTYQWYEVVGGLLAGETASSYVAAATGDYYCEVTDGDPGCGDTETTNSIMVTVNPNPTAVITPSGPTAFCEGGSVDLTASSATGTPPFTYLWAPGGETTAAITVTASDTYSVTITDSAVPACVDTSAGEVVTVNPNPTAVITPGGPTTFCEGGSVDLVASSATGTPPFTYQWYAGAAPIPGGTNATYTATATGNYSVEMTDSAVPACVDMSANEAVTVNPAPTAVITPSGPTAFCEGGSVDLVASSATGTPPFTYLWAPGGETTAAITVTASDTYSVTITDSAVP